jgi:hypothetical protein
MDDFFKQKRDFLILGLLLVVTALVYSITINGPFTYDDIEQITNNFNVHHISNLANIFHSLRPTRPLLNLFFALAWSIAPGQTWPFHIGLITIHLVNTALVFTLMRKIFSSTQKDRSILVWTSTFLFAFHPLQVLGISYIMGGIGAFQCFFYLICLNLYDPKSTHNDFKVRVLLSLSMLCKESCVLIPAVLIWWDLTLGGLSFKTLSYRRHALFILSSLVVMVPLYWFVSNPTTAYSDSTGFHLYPYGEYFLIQGRYYFLYLRLLVDSSVQSLIHPYPIYEPRMLITGILGWTMCASLVFFAFKWKLKKPVFSFLVGFFFLSLFLTNTFLQMSNPFAEYRLYQSNLAPFMGIALICPCLWLLWSCILMQLIWRSEVAIYVYSLSVYPESFELTQLLGGYYEGREEWDLAEEQYIKAIPLVKMNTGVVPFHPYRLLFRIYAHSGQWNKALKEIALIESELSGGKLQPDGYEVYLRILRRIQDKPRFDQIRKKALGFYPSIDFPVWEDRSKGVDDNKKGP